MLNTGTTDLYSIKKRVAFSFASKTQVVYFLCNKPIFPISGIP